MHRLLDSITLYWDLSTICPDLAVYQTMSIHPRVRVIFYVSAPRTQVKMDSPFPTVIVVYKR